MPLRKKDPCWSWRKRHGAALYPIEGSGWWKAYFFSQPHAATWHVGVIVGRKIGAAVVRNKIKRRLRQAFRLLAKEYTHPLTCIVTVRSPDVALCTFTEIEASLRASLSLYMKRSA